MKNAGKSGQLRGPMRGERLVDSDERARVF